MKKIPLLLCLLAGQFIPAFAWAQMANDTPMAVPEGVKTIASIVAGDKVLARGWGSSASLEPVPVKFSYGILPDRRGSTQEMVFVRYGEQRLLIATRNQAFLLATGKLILARQLVAGQALMTGDGGPATVSAVRMGYYSGGMHHISTNAAWNGNPARHLVVAGGLIVADYALQMHYPQLPAQFKH
ncbi:hypothetical protein ACFPOE_03065 [Caenimonas terrae]|uniref:Uncharacterized protein n=1 Tax=Caenimonas terrae TaxID=696074 RepID=A0ABW0N750_9BURK